MGEARPACGACGGFGEACRLGGLGVEQKRLGLLSFFVFDRDELNEFAAPVGIICVNTCLLLNAHIEA